MSRAGKVQQGLRGASRAWKNEILTITEISLSACVCGRSRTLAMTMTEMMSTRWPMTISKTESSQMPMPAKKEAVCESLTHWKAACS